MESCIETTRAPDGTVLPVLGHEVPLYSTEGMSRQDWLAARRQDRTVGASSVGAIMKHSPYATPLDAWAEITGRGRQFDDEERLAMEVGIACEPQIRRTASKILKTDVSTWPRVLRHPQIACMTCNLDGVALGKERPVPVEAKWGSWRQREAWKDLREYGTPESVAGTSLMVYWLQVQTQLAITGLPVGVLIGIIGEDAAIRMLLSQLTGRSYDVSSNDVFVTKIPRHEPTIDAIEKVIPRFHAKFIARDRQPPDSGARDLETLRRTFIASKPAPPVPPELPELAERCASYKETASDAAAKTKSRDDIKAGLISALAQQKVDAAVCGDWLLTYRANTKGTRSIGVRPLKKEGKK